MEAEMMEEKCGVFGCITNGDWPTNLDCAHIICLGLVGLQHRQVIRVNSSSPRVLVV